LHRVDGLALIIRPTDGPSWIRRRLTRCGMPLRSGLASALLLATLGRRLDSLGSALLFVPVRDSFTRFFRFKSIRARRARLAPFAVHVPCIILSFIAGPAPSSFRSPFTPLAKKELAVVEGDVSPSPLSALAAFGLGIPAVHLCEKVALFVRPALIKPNEYGPVSWHGSCYDI